MKVTEFTRKALAVRRERRDMERAGWVMHETDWHILRGGPSETRKIIVGVKISIDGKHVWTKIGSPGEQP